MCVLVSPSAKTFPLWLPRLSLKRSGCKKSPLSPGRGDKTDREKEQAGILLQSPEFLGLKRINLKLWQIEDDIRLKEQKKEFDEGFILLARSVYFSNDQRTTLKREINLKFASDLVEEKEYTSYQ